MLGDISRVARPTQDAALFHRAGTTPEELNAAAAAVYEFHLQLRAAGKPGRHMLGAVIRRPLLQGLATPC